MATLGPRKYLPGPPPQPPLYTLFGAASTVDEPNDRWINGLTVSGYPCGPVDRYSLCGGSAGIAKPAAAAPPLAYDVDPFTLVYPFRCRAYHGQVWDTVREQALAAFEAYEAQGFEEEFWTGELEPGNPHLTDNDTVTVLNGGTATSLRNAMGLLEQAIADSGAKGMIHTSACVGSDMAQSGGASKDGNKLVTPLGTIVVPGSGYHGTGPNGSTPGAHQRWAYATGLVAAWREPTARVIPDNITQAHDRVTNDVVITVERVYAAGWDRCLHAAVLVDRSKTTF